MARLPQLNVEVTPQVKAKLKRLEDQLVAYDADKHEIVGVLIERAKASALTPAELGRYRVKLARERRKAARAK
jgi:hypothetical protein